MKVTRLTVQNIGIVEDAVIEINKPEIVFYGDIKQGKSTLLNAVRWVCGGPFPADIIRHGQPEAAVQLEGEEEDGKPWVIRREWYTAKDGTATARPITYTRNGFPVKKPVDAIKAHLNPYLLDQDYLRKMTALERSRYLAELFGVDTSEQDAIISAAEQQAHQLRVKIKMYGAIDLTPVERVDVDQINAERFAIVAMHATKTKAAQSAIDGMMGQHEVACAQVDAGNEEARVHNSNVDRGRQSLKDGEAQVADLEARLADMKSKCAKTTAWLKANPPKPLAQRPPAPDVSEYRKVLSTQPDTAACDRALQDAGAQNVRAEQYEANKLKQRAKAVDEGELMAQERYGREAKAAKIKKLATVGASTGIAGLAFKEGGFDFDGTDSSMLSDSQLMRLSDALSSKYPEGFGLSMIDRGESLGKSVLTLWEEAQDRQATVMVTVVGDKPATVPEQVGAYVITAGKVTR